MFKGVYRGSTKILFFEFLIFFIKIFKKFKKKQH